MSETKDESPETTAPAKPADAPNEAAPAQGGAGAPDELAEALAHRDRLKDQLLRTAADFDNFRKRTQKDVADARRKAKEDVLREILPVIDNLERAVAASANATDVAAVAEGVRMVLRSFDDIAQRVSLERVKTEGARFDPNLHDAVQQVETDDHEPGTIVSEVVAGYRLDDKLLRPALVVVARPKAKAEG